MNTTAFATLITLLNDQPNHNKVDAKTPTKIASCIVATAATYLRMDGTGTLVKPREHHQIRRYINLYRKLGGAIGLAADILGLTDDQARNLMGPAHWYPFNIACDHNMAIATLRDFHAHGSVDWDRLRLAELLEQANELSFKIRAKELFAA